MTIADLPDDLNDYYKEKCRDLPTGRVTPVSKLLQELDNATIRALNLGGSVLRVEEAFEAVLKHPDSTWTRETLAYRQRQVHYK